MKLEQFPGGQVGAALVDNNGRIVEVIGFRNRSTMNAGSTSSALSFTCVVPNTVRTGTYRLMAVVKQGSGEWRLVTLALPDVPNSINFQVNVNRNIVVAPMSKAKWSQDTPYNDLFPMVDNEYFRDNIGRAVTGCGITAAAILMAHHRHPVRGREQSTSIMLYPKNITVPSVNLNVAYDWNNIAV